MHALVFGILFFPWFLEEPCGFLFSSSFEDQVRIILPKYLCQGNKRVPNILDWHLTGDSLLLKVNDWVIWSLSALFQSFHEIIGPLYLILEPNYYFSLLFLRGNKNQMSVQTLPAASNRLPTSSGFDNKDIYFFHTSIFGVKEFQQLVSQLRVVTALSWLICFL